MVGKPFLGNLKFQCGTQWSPTTADKQCRKKEESGFRESNIIKGEKKKNKERRIDERNYNAICSNDCYLKNIIGNRDIKER